MEQLESSIKNAWNYKHLHIRCIMNKNRNKVLGGFKKQLSSENNHISNNLNDFSEETKRYRNNIHPINTNLTQKKSHSYQASNCVLNDYYNNSYFQLRLKDSNSILNANILPKKKSKRKLNLVLRAKKIFCPSYHRSRKCLNQIKTEQPPETKINSIQLSPERSSELINEINNKSNKSTSTKINTLSKNQTDQNTINEKIEDKNPEIQKKEKIIFQKYFKKEQANVNDLLITFNKGRNFNDNFAVPERSD